MAKKRSSKLLSWLLTLAMVLSLAAGMSITAFAQDNDIIVLYTNDVHCGVDDNIGYAGLALYKKQMQQQTPYVILADAGDAIQGAPIGTLSEGGYLVDIMNQVGYDFAIPGNHEFDYGMNRFLELAGKLDCGYYSSNFVDLRTGNTVFAPYKMFTFGDVKVALVGASTPESFTKSTPSYFQDANGTYVYGFCEDESGESLYAKIQSSVDAARNDGAAYVILVGHLGENGTTERWSSDAVIAHTNGIDAVIDGHSHETVPNKTIANKDGKQIPLTQTGTKLKNIGKLTIKADGTITTELVDKVPAEDTTSSYTVKTGDSLSRIAKSQLGSASRWKEIYDANRDKIRNKNLLYAGMKLTIPGSVRVTEDGKAVDAQTDSYIKSIQAIYQESLKTVLGHTDVDLTDKNPETGERAVRNAETNLGDLTADAYRYELGAEIGLSNGGGIRSFIAAGNITYENTLAVFPYGNMACLIEVTGQQLKDALEMASKNYPQESGGFLQVSGVTYTIDSTVLSSVKLDDKGNFLGVSGAYRVTDIQVNGEPLDLNRTYTLASHNYMLKSAGDGMTMFKDAKILKDEVMTDVDVLSDYINTHLGGNVGAEYANPAGQGRIVIK
ncbi:MAG: bifunctional metallophosphatase/5'-nucleotidase [Clostridiaceae bacterium]|nr:bifunctional metallophosphatase/5'-nucleotidase [Clostridiaceae bacterium]